MTIHLYFVSPTRMAAAVEQGGDSRITIKGNTLTAELDPVARVAVPLTTAVELAFLIVRTVLDGAPTMSARLTEVGGMMAEALKRAGVNEAGAGSVEGAESGTG